MDDILQHYGTKYHSGRYPWGSGGNVPKSMEFLTTIDEMKKGGMTEKAVAEHHGMSIIELRAQISIASNERKQWLKDGMVYLRDAGKSNAEIAKELGISESTVRNQEKQKEDNKKQTLHNVANVLKEEFDNGTLYLDVGVGVERQLGVSRQKLKAAIEVLKADGYVEHDIQIKQLTGSGKWTTIRVLTKEKDLDVVRKNSDKITQPEKWTDDGAITFQGLKPIKSMSWDRVEIRYAEDGGADKDGIVGIRRNSADLDMGKSQYAQVRIAVDGTHYMKGMAMYEDKMPPGKDAIFYTNKTKDVPPQKVLKEMKSNKDNPFGATIKRQNGMLNIVNEEGDWDKWGSSLSAQFLSKQNIGLVNDRINSTYKSILEEYNEIQSVTNPVVKKHLMETFDDGLTSKARHLKLAGIARTKGHVLLPFNDIKPEEVYAPNYKDGERVVLIRYPHGGIFELPELIVNNKTKGPKGVIGSAQDAVGIHPSIASKLSGADFDGDTVYVVPNNDGKIKTSRTLPELRNFEPNMYKRDYDTIKSDTKQIEMGKVSNLITDMTIKGASQQEIARAVRHSMVVIDSEKHKLDYKQSAVDHGINALKKKYQSHEKNGKISIGASTIISRSKQDLTEDFIDDSGKKRSKKVGYLMDETKDAHTLSSGTKVEAAYADYVNSLKSLQTTVKKDIDSIPTPKRDPQATKQYALEVASLDAKLNKALLNAPRERQAQLLATNTYYKNLDYDMDKDQKKKLRTQSLAAAREKTGAKKDLVIITDREWEAIQAGAISTNKLTQIIKNTDVDQLRKLATPRQETTASKTQMSKMTALLNKGYTTAEIATAMGLTTAQVKLLLNKE